MTMLIYPPPADDFAGKKGVYSRIYITYFCVKYRVMKITKQVVVSFILLVIVASLYRVLPGRPFGFAPQWAMAIFAGAIIKNKKYSFLLPLASMFVSDALYEVLYRSGASNIKGFYSGQERRWPADADELEKAGMRAKEFA